MAPLPPHTTALAQLVANTVYHAQQLMPRDACGHAAGASDTPAPAGGEEQEQLHAFREGSSGGDEDRGGGVRRKRARVLWPLESLVQHTCWEAAR